MNMHGIDLEEAIQMAIQMDPFDEHSPSPDESHALMSSLWELSLLDAHYDPRVIQSIDKLKSNLVRSRQRIDDIIVVK